MPALPPDALPPLIQPVDLPHFGFGKLAVPREEFRSQGRPFAERARKRRVVPFPVLI